VAGRCEHGNEVRVL